MISDFLYRYIQSSTNSTGRAALACAAAPSQVWVCVWLLFPSVVVQLASLAGTSRDCSLRLLVSRLFDFFKRLYGSSEGWGKMRVTTTQPSLSCLVAPALGRKSKWVDVAVKS